MYLPYVKGPEAAEFAAVAIPQLLVSKASSLRYMPDNYYMWIYGIFC